MIDITAVTNVFRDLPGRVAPAARRYLGAPALAVGQTLHARLHELPRDLGLWTRRRTVGQWARRIAVVAAVLTLLGLEGRTGLVQSHVFAALASALTWTIAPGPSARFVPAPRGPMDQTRGYAHIDRFVQRLDERGFFVVDQARFSPALELLSRAGVTPPDPEKLVAGLVVRDRWGDTIHDGRPREHFFARYEDVPPVVARSLLYIEDRRVADDDSKYANPVVNWGRLAKATGLYAANQLSLPVRVEGGSTLAIQLEKFRHSPDGRTESGLDKLRQIVGASLRVYHDGPDTRADRQVIVRDYLNALPLAGAPSYGEVTGLGAGLRVWFGLDPEQVFATLADTTAPKSERAAQKRLDRQARALKPVLALICAAQAPTDFLVRDHQALEARIRLYGELMARDGVLDPELVARTLETPLAFTDPADRPRLAGVRQSYAARKGYDAIRVQLLGHLGVSDLYALDRLDLAVETTIDGALQRDAAKTLLALGDTSSGALRGPRLLAQGENARRIDWSLILLERTTDGDAVCAWVDNVDQPFDVNRGMKLELGSTAKLRTLAHYLETAHLLHRELAGATTAEKRRLARDAKDPLTRWAAGVLAARPHLPSDSLVAGALERTYSASPHETFFTGGGLHHFANFDAADNGKTYTVREATARSTNLVYVRMMRDLVAYHAARLPYDAWSALNDRAHPDRRELLQRAADDESRIGLSRGWRGQRARAREIPGESRADRQRAAMAALRHPLERWAAGRVAEFPDLTLDELWKRSGRLRDETSRWLFTTKRPHAQDRRIRARIEQDAFERMTPAWRRLGFPFKTLVPSYATALGSSGDRPEALAELMAIILGDGVRLPSVSVKRLEFAAATPYQTVIDRDPSAGEAVLAEPVARALREVLGEVVERGTAVRLRGVFRGAAGETLAIGGKTGTGDNRVERVGRGGRTLSSRSTSRSSAFVFFLGDRHVGVLTATVLGREASRYGFTSALTLEALKQLAPAIRRHLVAAGDLDEGDVATQLAAQAAARAARTPPEIAAADSSVAADSAATRTPEKPLRPIVPRPAAPSAPKPAPKDSTQDEAKDEGILVARPAPPSARMDRRAPHAPSR
jgi:membrane peptidoglycan carboxypeptidase